ncbi:restriction endonuclease subunit S [Staphylococcus aureus]|uniref:Type I restriction modification DNA specificity domain protein n=1 Tax=Staphylococcus aureus TaxID=1280 RepID=A0A8G2HYM0_STAAU|nr:restriction endonuclease subunit S [Staphylococcus aureus]SUK17978.1 type I restriction modification DNA specificity domain protein [Staphylococcus aureus]SUK38927.1 type I restriction modification DNA specificity domain protein [Staphylococcus aureus]
MSNTQTKNVPELRFPGFEGEYSLDIFGNLATNKSDKFNPQNEDASIDIELDCIEQNTGRLIKIYNSKEFSSQKNKFNPQNVLYGKLRPYLNKYYFTKKSGVCSSEIWVLKSTKEDKLLNLFLYYFIQTKRYSDVASKSAGSKMPRADWGLVENIRVYFPELCEQQKIGEFFSKLDRQIELEEQKLELLQQQKKGYMQKIFSQELRFKDENGNDYPEWQKKKLKEIAYVYTGNTPSKKENIYWIKGEYVWVTPTDINNSKNIYESEHKLTQEGYKKARQLPENTLLVTCIASIGKNAILRKQGSCNQQINAVVPFENINIDYLYYISDSLSTFMKSIAGKTATQIVNKNTFENLELYLASFEEQNKIADLISSLEELIEKQASKLIKMKSRKQGLLQKMFI